MFSDYSSRILDYTTLVTVVGFVVALTSATTSDLGPQLEQQVRIISPKFDDCFFEGLRALNCFFILNLRNLLFFFTFIPCDYLSRRAFSEGFVR